MQTIKGAAALLALAIVLPASDPAEAGVITVSKSLNANDLDNAVLNSTVRSQANAQVTTMSGQQVFRFNGVNGRPELARVPLIDAGQFNSGNFVSLSLTWRVQELFSAEAHDSFVGIAFDDVFLFSFNDGNPGFNPSDERVGVAAYNLNGSRSSGRSLGPVITGTGDSLSNLQEPTDYTVNFALTPSTTSMTATNNSTGTSQSRTFSPIYTISQNYGDTIDFIIMPDAAGDTANFLQIDATAVLTTLTPPPPPPGVSEPSSFALFGIGIFGLALRRRLRNRRLTSRCTRLRAARATSGAG